MELKTKTLIDWLAKINRRIVLDGDCKVEELNWKEIFTEDSAWNFSLSSEMFDWNGIYIFFDGENILGNDVIETHMRYTVDDFVTEKNTLENIAEDIFSMMESYENYYYNW